MKITKYGHCCLLIEVEGLRILTDPGAYSTTQSEAREVDVVLITHEHQDHLHIESVKQIMKNNPAAVIVTNASVGKILAEEGIAFQVVDDGKQARFKNVLIEGIGTKHAEIYRDYKAVENTGYRIAERLFYPGDAFTDPQKPVEILALPVAGPWLKMSEVLDYALALKPKVAFPVHDGMLKFGGPNYLLPKMVLEPKGITFQVLEENIATDIGL